jgi:hypothetical protein
MVRGAGGVGKKRKGATKMKAAEQARRCKKAGNLGKGAGDK